MVQIRSYKPDDRDAIYRIAFDTALYGEPLTPLFRDVPFIGEALLAAYIETEPEHLLIAEHEGKVIGYLTGTLDSAKITAYNRDVVRPRLKWTMIKRGLFLKPGLWKILSARRQTVVPSRVKEIAHHYPAHLHINLTGAARGKGTGGALVGGFFLKMNERGVRRAHVMTGTEGGKSFFSRMGFEKALAYPGPVFPHSAPRDIWVMTYSS